ncbi:uncharacterized protein BKA55DRAFT_591764 [Fusarium redolens]|uniref:CBM-cenC domain-containing protein n=1 Tax=Fusarium redolens TaxID=48865 RepID=A0A9P9HJV6_FUSRE|nr:uncharacterized protein BKA55DRAFT_591764 [Fusarium redolens]KAH7258949.1 hypothetical protein BKA55DRAFT_591764 [Fusarium redolens]
MVRLSLLNVAAIATLLLGAEAGPCRPTTTAVTSLAEASSTTGASYAETTSTVAADTTATSVDMTTVTTLADTTTTTKAESTTTTAAPACLETQALINPGFDDRSDSISPWTGNGGLIQREPQAGVNALAFIFNYGQGNGYVKQTLDNLDGDYEFSYYYRVLSASVGADYTCDIELTVGDTTLRGDMDYSVGGWKSGSVNWSSGGENLAQGDVQLSVSCGGEFDKVQVNIDSLAFTRVCSV